MLILPAIDLIDGHAVRLLQGDYEQKTEYSADPVDVARDFARLGATHIHLVDLDGARSGGTPNLDLILRIKQETGLFCEVGGGIRNMDTVRRYLSAGIDRVILGTAAVTVPGFAAEAAAEFGHRAAVGVDLRDGQVAVKGWTESAGLDGSSFCREMQAAGVQNLIVTDISRDGAMQGTNLDLYRRLQQELSVDITASGGVSSLEDVTALKEMGLYAAIIGKAYYTGAIDLQKALEAAK